jgi:K+ transporter
MTMQSRRKLIGEIMVALEFVSIDQINDARRYQMQNNAKRLGECLVELGYVTEQDVQRSLEVQTIT